MTERPVSIAVQFHWQLLGRLRNDAGQGLIFPVAPHRPGLYRFRLHGNGVPRHYVGETDELRRRFRHYRTPGKSQQTNIRMNGEFRDHLAAGGSIEIDIVVDSIDVMAADQPVPVDLDDKSTRRLLEHAALVDETSAGVHLLNR